nr:hypothetical protein [Tanacetum cinerariifolium]
MLIMNQVLFDDLGITGGKGVKKLVEEHSCIRSNKGGNRRATQGWIANVVSDKLKSDGDVSVTQLKKWLMKHYNVELRYQKEPGSVVDIDFERNGDKKCFQRFFISLIACSMGFLAGCRPYISLDACHLKGKFNGVLVAATGIDGNSSMFPVAYGILELENTSSWIHPALDFPLYVSNPIGMKESFLVVNPKRTYLSEVQNGQYVVIPQALCRAANGAAISSLI